MTALITGTKRKRPIKGDSFFVDTQKPLQIRGHPRPDALFPDDPLQQVASPVQVIVNGIAVASKNQVGWPGTIDTYRVDFRMPDETAPGLATVRLVAAWIPGGAIQIPVQ